MLSVGDVIEATGGKVSLQGPSVFSGVSIDSRTIKTGEVFLPIRGEKFDGHDFLKQALRTGEGAIINAKPGIGDGEFSGKTIILVDDTLGALHDLAKYFRKKFSGHVVGIVGSNGKTTTKELVASILATRLDVIKTTGNYNNHIGMPLSVVNGAVSGTGGKERVMVLEMGTNRPGDVKELCDISTPEIGVVTNIGYEHLEGFGSLEKVRESELEIVPYVKKLVLNADDIFLLGGITTAFREEIISFGIESRDASVTARDIVFSDDLTGFKLWARGEYIDIASRLPGRFNIYNSLAAASAAIALGFRLDEIKKGLESFGGVGMRFEIRKLGGATFLNDIYNANPSSMEESLKEMERRFRAEGSGYKRAVAVLGDMLELGDYAVNEHKKLGRRLSELQVDTFIGAGPLMSLAAGEFKGKSVTVADSAEAGLELKKILRESDLVLIKGSRGMKMEQVLKEIGGA